MSVNRIENQVLNFENSLLDKPCLCEGRKFIRKINKNDITQVEFLSTIVNGEPEFNNQGSWLFENTNNVLNPNPPGDYTSLDFDPINIGKYIIYFGVFYQITGGGFVLNQNRFTIDGGLNWYNETTNPSLSFDNIGSGTHICIVEDTIYGTSWTRSYIIP